MKKDRGLSLARKISIMLVIMLIVISAVIGVLSYVMYRGDTISVNAEKAMAIADSVAAGIDGAQFAEIMSTGEVNEHWEAAKAMADGVKIRTGAQYLYVLDSRYGDEVTYFVEGIDPNDIGENPYTLYDTEVIKDDKGELIYAEEMFDAIHTGQRTMTGIYASGEYGMMVSGFSPIKNGNTVVGVVGVDLAVGKVLDSVNRFGLLIIIIVAGLCLLFAVIAVWLIGRMVGRPIRALTEASQSIAAGDTDIKLDVDSRDEIGMLAGSFRVMVSSTARQVEIMDKLADGDLTVQVTPRGQRDVMSLAMQRMVVKLSGMFDEIRTGTAQVSVGSQSIAQGSQALAQGATEQASTVERLAGTIGGVAELTRDSAQLARRASELSGDIKRRAEQGTGQMDMMTRSVGDIDSASRSIGKVIKVIDDIAFQTNILALNAAVEAARAGQHGKGFAVVAEEVRSLAGKSAEAAKETAALIDNSIEKAAEGVRIATETSESFAGIVSGISESSAILGEIAESSERQRVAIDEINDGIDQVAIVVQQNSATAEQSAAASELMSSQASMLDSLLDRFKLNEGTGVAGALPDSGARSLPARTQRSEDKY